MKKVSYFVIFCMLAFTVAAFDNQISYAGIDIINSSSSNAYNGSFDITTYVFSSSTCSGSPLFSEATSGVQITNGNYVVTINNSLSDENITFYVKSSIQTENQTCFKYTPAAQSNLANNATFCEYVNGYSSSTLPIAGDVTGTLASSSVAALDLSAITYSNELGFNNLTQCSNGEILKVGSGLWACDSDSTGNTCNDVSCTLSDDTIGLSGNSYTGTLGIENITENALIVTNNTGVWNVNISCTNIQGGSDGDYCSDAGGADTNTNVTAIQFTKSGNIVTLDLEQPGLSNLTATFTDSGNSTAQMITAVNNTALNGSSFVSILCSNIVFDNGIGSSAICDGLDATGGSSSKWITDKIYLYNDTDEIFFNETKLNATIDSRDSDTTYTADGLYLYLSTLQFTFNETKLNNTIDVRDTDTDTNANTECSGTTTYLDGEGNCDDISGVYIAQADESSLNVNKSLYWDDLNSPSDINAVDITDDNTYVTVAGDTMTGNLVNNNNVTAENFLFENDPANHKIYDNSTCIIIISDTTTWELC